ncbi:MAG TPA: VOC family protein [Solirubrobacterales bacterium]|nr:VOC family protein [Solirubrobacterales bacterium]
MSERTSYAPGTPCWVDLGSSDVGAATDFYGGLFGWDVPEGENTEQTGGYRQALQGGMPVAGMYPLTQEGQPPAWTTYVSVADASVVAGKVRDAGGTVVTEPLEVLDLGSMAVFTDPTGAVFGVWQPGTFAGAGRVNEPGTLSWNELNTRDVSAAAEFYGAIFGWTFESEDMGEAGSYTTIHLGGSPVGGILNQRGRGVPEEVPPYWAVYFAVEDTDAMVEKAKQLGGSVMVEPVDIPVGRFAILTDPHGASFAVIALSPEAGASG